MASVYKHSRGNSRYWIAVFSDETGKQRHRSTKATDQAIAQATADQLERASAKIRKQREKNGETRIKNSELVVESLISAAQRANEGSFTDSDARITLNHILESVGNTPLSNTTAKEFLTRWIGSKKLSKAASTATRYGGTVGEFLKSIGSEAEKNLSSVNSQQVEAFRDLQLKEGKTNKTANLVLKTLNIPFNLARRQGLILVNPVEAVDLLPEDSEERKPFTQNQILDLLEKADDEWQGLILVGVCVGLRLKDASRIRWENVDLDKRLVTTKPTKTKGRSQKKTLQNVMLPDLEVYLRAHAPENPSPESYIFPRLSQMSVSGKSGLSMAFTALMISVGIDPEVIPKKGAKGRNFSRLSFHSLKHTYISLMANARVEKELRKKLVGHTTDVHDRYTHHELETIRKALKKFPRFLPRSKKS